MELRRFYLVASVMLLALMASCNQDAMESVDDSFFESATRANGKPLEIDYSALDTMYYVSLKDVDAYVNFKKLQAEGKGKPFAISDVKPIHINGDVTLCYLLKYENGWEIISADKRAPVVLASAEEGTIELESIPNNLAAWLNSLAIDVLLLRADCTPVEEAPKDVREDMMSSVDFWSCVTADADYIQRKSGGMTRSDPQYIYYPTGYWVLESVTDYDEDYDSKPHLLQTAWIDQSPYNAYSPLKSNGMGYRASAGSQAVAGAQMLYYLHNKLGRPVNAPTNAFCNAVIPNIFSYNMYTYGSSSTVWNDMSTDADKCAVLIADVGIKVHMEYRDSYSNAITSDLIPYVFNPAGISASQGNYNPSTVYNNLVSNNPVIINARYEREVNGWIEVEPMPYSLPDGDIIVQYSGRAFIIDAYKRKRNVHKCCYRWVYDNPDGNLPVPMPDYSQVITYSSPVLTGFQMNWGQSGSYNSIWFSPSGDWMIGSYCYNQDVTMIYGFSNL